MFCTEATIRSVRACGRGPCPVAGLLFPGEATSDNQASGTIYVRRSKSDPPVVAADREPVHKIGVTNVSVEQRIAGAQLQPPAS